MVGAAMRAAHVQPEWSSHGSSQRLFFLWFARRVNQARRTCGGMPQGLPQTTCSSSLAEADGEGRHQWIEHCARSGLLSRKLPSRAKSSAGTLASFWAFSDSNAWPGISNSTVVKRFGSIVIYKVRDGNGAR